MNWRFVIAVFALVALVTSAISLSLAVNSPSAHPVRTCWYPFDKKDLRWSFAEILKNDLACPFVLHGLATCSIGLFLLGFLVVSVLRCIIPPHIISPFEENKFVMAFSYTFIMILFSMAFSCFLSTIGLLHHYSSTLTEEYLLKYYTGCVVTDCFYNGNHNCSSIVLLFVSTLIVGFGVSFGIVEIVSSALHSDRRGYSSL